jgi:hypothetical protein
MPTLFQEWAYRHEYEWTDVLGADVKKLTKATRAPYGLKPSPGEHNT